MSPSPSLFESHSPTLTQCHGGSVSINRHTSKLADRVFIVFLPDGSLQLHHCESMTVADVLLNHPFHSLSTSASNPVCLPLEKHLKPTGQYFLHKIRSSTDSKQRRHRGRAPVRSHTEPESERRSSRQIRPISRHNSLKDSSEEFVNVPHTYVSAVYRRALPNEVTIYNDADLLPNHHYYAYSRPMETSSSESGDGRLSPLSAFVMHQMQHGRRRRQPQAQVGPPLSSNQHRDGDNVAAKPKNPILEELESWNESEPDTSLIGIPLSLPLDSPSSRASASGYRGDAKGTQSSRPLHRIASLISRLTRPSSRTSLAGLGPSPLSGSSHHRAVSDSGSGNAAGFHASRRYMSEVNLAPTYLAALQLQAERDEAKGVSMKERHRAMRSPTVGRRSGEWHVADVLASEMMQKMQHTVTILTAT